MKLTKKNRKFNNIKKVTKKCNYRKIKKGGLNFFSKAPKIKRDIDSIVGFENNTVSFPFKNMHIDISLQDKNLNQALNEWACDGLLATLTQRRFASRLIAIARCRTRAALRRKVCHARTGQYR